MMLRCSMSPQSPRQTEKRSRSVSCSLSILSLYCRTCRILCDSGCAADAVFVSVLMRQATSCRLVSDPMACPRRGCTCYKIAHRSCRTISRTIWSGWESHMMSVGSCRTPHSACCRWTLSRLHQRSSTLLLQRACNCKVMPVFTAVVRVSSQCMPLNLWDVAFHSCM